MREILEELQRWEEEGVGSGVATLLRVRGSGLRRPGARFAAAADGRVVGSVSGGCVEGDLQEHLRGRIEGREGPERLRYGISDEQALEVGLPCGGEIEVLVDGHEPDDPAWRAAVGAVAAEEPALLALGLEAEALGRRLAVLPDGRTAGSLGTPELDRAVRERAGPYLRRGGAGVEALGEEEREVFLEAHLPPDRLAVVGATPVARVLARLAGELDFRVTVVDPRRPFARPDRFPGARVVEGWPEEGLEAAGLDPYLYVVVLSHDRKLDVPALEAALEADCRYVGLLGGSRTQRLRREALEERGLEPERLDRIRGPVGLDLGAETPAEIALAVLAEVVAERRSTP